MRYLPLSDADRGDMLRVIGAGSIDELFRDVPEAARLSGPIAGLPNHAVGACGRAAHGKLSRKNLVAGEVPFFLGCGAYRHHVPASVDHIIQRGEFLTSYTPYQPEIAQGTLQVLFEFQTQVARLYGCDVANASMYDGSTACWEAIGMARRITRRNEVAISSGAASALCQRREDDGAVYRRPLDTALPELDAETDAERLIAAIDERDQRGGRPISRHSRADRRPDADRRGRARRGRAADRGGHRAGGARPDQVAGRNGRRHRRRRGPVDRRRAAVRRALCRPVRLPRKACPPDARAACRRDRRRRGQARLRADPVDPRAAYPPRESDVEHLHQLRACARWPSRST